MSDLTMEFTDTLVVVTCWCGINHAVPENLRNYQLRAHRDGRESYYIHCPLGHTHAPAGKGEAEKLREQLQRATQRAAAERDLREDTERRLTAQKAATTRAKQRHAAGVCPVCRRSFKQLRTHVAKQHPDYEPTKETT